MSILEESKDFPTDELLIYLVRLQLIRNKAASVAWEHMGPAGDEDNRVPQRFYFQALNSQLEQFKRSIPPALRSNGNHNPEPSWFFSGSLTLPTVILQFSILETVLSLHDHCLSTSKETSFDPDAQIRRMENLWTCFTTVKSFFNSFLSLESFPISSYPQISMTVFIQKAHCLVALFQLSTFELAGIPWDRQRVLEELNFGDVARTLADRWDKVPVSAVLNSDFRSENDESPWTFGRRAILFLLNWWETKIAPKLSKSADQGVEETLADASKTLDQQEGDTMDFAPVNLDFLDDVWMKDMLGGGFEYFREPFF